MFYTRLVPAVIFIVVFIALFFRDFVKMRGEYTTYS